VSRSVTEILQLYAVRTVTSSYTAVFSLTVPQVSVAGYIQVSIFLVFKKVILRFVVKSHVNLERHQDPEERKIKGIKKNKNQAVGESVGTSVRSLWRSGQLARVRTRTALDSTSR